MLSGTEEDFKFWRTDFLSFIKGTSGKSKGSVCQCSSGSNPQVDETFCQSDEGPQENEGQDDEVTCERKKKTHKHNINLI